MDSIDCICSLDLDASGENIVTAQSGMGRPNIVLANVATDKCLWSVQAPGTGNSFIYALT